MNAMSVYNAVFGRGAYVLCAASLLRADDMMRAAEQPSGLYRTTEETDNFALPGYDERGYVYLEEADEVNYSTAKLGRSLAGSMLMLVIIVGFLTLIILPNPTGYSRKGTENVQQQTHPVRNSTQDLAHCGDWARGVIFCLRDCVSRSDVLGDSLVGRYHNEQHTKACVASRGIPQGIPALP